MVVSPRAQKRLTRGSSDTLLAQEGCARLPAKRQEVEQSVSAYSELLQPIAGETQPAFFARLASRLRQELFSAAHIFDRDGLYIYKRPVISASGDKAALLASGGSVFHHVVVYVKQGEELTALEMSPGNLMDITDDLINAESPPGPLVLRPAPPPEKEHLPMLHIGVRHHPLEAPHVQQALRLVEGTRYHALRNNCIAFADFVVRVLTGGAVRGAPLIFDALVGQVPPVESPLLLLLGMAMQLTWHDVCDGRRLLRAFLQQHPAGLAAPPGGEPLDILVAEAATEAAIPAKAAAAASAAAPPNLAALLGLLPPGALAAAGPQLAGMLGTFAGAGLPATLPQAAAAAALPTASSGSSDDTVGAIEVDASVTEAVVEKAVGASSGASNPLGSVSQGEVASKLGTKGPALPPRKPRAAAARA